jgi:hypothetical protein
MQQRGTLSPSSPQDDALTDELDSFLASIQQNPSFPKSQRERSIAERMRSTIKEEPLSADICSLTLKGRVGNYSVFKTFSKYFAIGTNLGLVLLFNKEQTLQCVLGSSGLLDIFYLLIF